MEDSPVKWDYRLPFSIMIQANFLMKIKHFSISFQVLAILFFKREDSAKLCDETIHIYISIIELFSQKIEKTINVLLITKDLSKLDL